MATVEAVRKILAEEYGIHSDRELQKALKKVHLNIGVMASPVRKESVRNGKNRCTA